MNTGAFGEGFPYTNFHDLNMDWIIKIAKDFLDQYTHIQQIIEDGETSLTELTNSGLEQLEEKATTLTNALDAWYNEHSEDIANQLSNALADFAQAYQTYMTNLNTALNNAITQFGVSAEAKAQETIESIPADYSAVAQDVIQLKKALSVHTNIIKFENMVTVPNKYIDNTTGLEVTDNTWTATGYIPLPENCFLMYPIFPTAGSSTYYNCFYDIEKNRISQFYTDRKQFVPANARYIRCSINTNQYDTIILCFVTGEELVHNAENSIVFQGSVSSIETLADNSVNVTLKHNVNNNLGYFQPPTGVELYFNGRGGTNVSTNMYRYNIPLYKALVLDMSELLTSNGQLQAKVVNYENIKPYHLVLIRNCQDNTGLKITGIMIVDNILKNVSTNRISNKDEVMKSICRMGDAYGLPETAEGVQGAYNAGYNYIRLNLQFTSDGQAVLWHDPYLNQYYHNVYDENGDLVPYSVDNRISISGSTKATLDQYRYGSATAPTGIPTLANALQMARKIGMKVYLETKSILSSGNINSLLTLLYKYGMFENTTICTADFEMAIMLSNRTPKIRIGLMAEFLTENMRTTFSTIIANGNPVMWWGYKSTSITNEMLYFISPQISYEVGDFQTVGQVSTYLNNPNSWACSGMEMEGFVNPLIGQYIESL